MDCQLSVFDLDHTLLKVNSSFKFGQYLYQKNVISTSEIFFSLLHYTRHKWLGLSIIDVHQKIFQQIFKGKSKREIERHTQDFIHAYLEEMFYKPALQKLLDAQIQGHYIVLLSSSPDFLVHPIAHQLNISDCQATKYTCDEQENFCSVSRVIDGFNKAEYVQLLAQKFQIPTTSITVYSDSYLDLPVLKMAGKAIGVVPDRHLRRVCIKHGWEII